MNFHTQKSAQIVFVQILYFLPSFKMIFNQQIQTHDSTTRPKVIKNFVNLIHSLSTFVLKVNISKLFEFEPDKKFEKCLMLLTERTVKLEKLLNSSRPGLNQLILEGNNVLVCIEQVADSIREQVEDSILDNNAFTEFSFDLVKLNKSAFDLKNYFLQEQKQKENEEDDVDYDEQYQQIRLMVELEFEQNQWSEQTLEYDELRPAVVIKQQKKKSIEEFDFLLDRLKNLSDSIGLGEKEIKKTWSKLIQSNKPDPTVLPVRSKTRSGKDYPLHLSQKILAPNKPIPNKYSSKQAYIKVLDPNFEIVRQQDTEDPYLFFQDAYSSRQVPPFFNVLSDIRKKVLTNYIKAIDSLEPSLVKSLCNDYTFHSSADLYENIVFLEICGPVLLKKKDGTIQTNSCWEEICQIYPSIKTDTPEILVNNLNTKFLRQDLPLKSQSRSDYLGTVLVSILQEKVFPKISKPSFAEFYYEQFSNICYCFWVELEEVEWLPPEILDEIKSSNPETQSLTYAQAFFPSNKNNKNEIETIIVFKYSGYLVTPRFSQIALLQKEFQEKFNKPGQLMWSRLGDQWSKDLAPEIKNNVTNTNALKERAKYVHKEFQTHLTAFKKKISSKKRKPILIHVDKKQIPINLQDTLVEKQDIFAMQGRFVGNHALNTRFEQEMRLAISWIAFVECLAAKKHVPATLLEDLESILKSFVVNEKIVLTFMNQLKTNIVLPIQEKNNLIDFIAQSLGERDIIYKKLLDFIQNYQRNNRLEVEDFLEVVQNLNRNY